MFKTLNYFFLIIFIPVRLISFNTETGINRLSSKVISKFSNSNSVSWVLLNLEIIVSLVMFAFLCNIWNIVINVIYFTIKLLTIYLSFYFFDFVLFPNYNLIYFLCFLLNNYFWLHQKGFLSAIL